jgi:hypothetical protein
VLRSRSNNVRRHRNCSDRICWCSSWSRYCSFATVTAAGIKGKGEGSISCGLVGLLASLGAAGGLVLGAVFGASVIQQRVASPQPSMVANPTQSSTFAQPVQPNTALINRLLLGSNVPISSLVRDIQNPSQVSQEQLESVVRIIQSEADRLHSARVEGNSVTLSANNWWLAWCSNVPAQYTPPPVGWSYLFEQKLPTFGQIYVVSPTAENRLLESCNSPRGWWAAVVYLNNP